MRLLTTFITLTCISISSMARVSQKHPDCPSTKITPFEFRSILRSSFRDVIENGLSGIQDPGQFMCCLPPQVRTGQVMLSPFSRAGQNGEPDSPRALVAYGDRIIFSINGGQPHMNKPNSVEAVYDNPLNGKLEYYDIDFTNPNSPRVNGPNPSECMQCHAGGDFRRDGPRPILEVNFGDWPTFINSIPGDQRECTRLERQIRAHGRDRAAQAMNSNPHYRCLTGQPTNPGRMENFLQEANAKRIARKIRRYPSSDQWKFLVVGMAARCVDVENFGDWIPANILSEMTNTSTLSQHVVNTNNPYDACLRFEAEGNRMNQGVYKQQRINLQKARNRENFNLPVLMASNACFAPNHYDGNSLCEKQSRTPFQSLYERFETDMFFQHRRQRVSEPERYPLNFRYLFESRGISISDWNMARTDGYLRVSDVLNSNILTAYKNDRDIIRAFGGLQNINQHIPASNNSNQAPPGNTCENLRKRSLLNLQVLSPDNEDTSVSP